MAKNDFTASNVASNFQPIFTNEQVQEFEANYNETWGVSRRVMMMTL
jgi:hypothetical protein